MNNLVPQNPQVGARQGDWMWDGTRWICCPDGNCDGQFPPFGPPVFSGPVNQPPWYPGANGGVSFGSVAPPNPVRGHFWWDGTTLWIFDGAAWDAVGGAGGTVITPPGSTFPPNPVPGEQFFDGKTLWVYDGHAWVPVSQTKTYIQATAPPNPNPGDLWFDGTQLHIWSGSAWALVGPGATVGPVPTSTEVFQIAQPTDISISASGFSVVPFTSSPTIDVLNAWNASTHKYQPNKAGLYVVFLCGESGPGGGGGGAIAKNDPGTYLAGSGDKTVAIGSNTAASSLFAAGGVAMMNGTTDYFRLFGLNASGTWYGLGQQPTMTIALLA